MTTRLYDSARDARWTGYDVTGADALSIQLVGAGYTFDAAHQFADDLTDELGDVIALASVSVSDGQVLADDPVVTGLSNGDVIKGVVVYNDTGTPATSPLLGFIDKRADTTPISFTSDGSNLTVPLSGGIVAQIAAAA